MTLPSRCHCTLSPLCRGHLYRASTGRNHQFGEDSVHLHRCSPPSEPICSSVRLAWCRSQTSPGSGSFPPAPPARSSEARSGLLEPFGTQTQSGQIVLENISEHLKQFVSILPLVKAHKYRIIFCAFLHLDKYTKMSKCPFCWVSSL